MTTHTAENDAPMPEEQCACRDCLALRYPVAAATPGTFLHDVLTRVTPPAKGRP